MPASIIALLLLPVALLSGADVVHRVFRRQWGPGLLALLLPIGCEAIALKSAVCLHRDWDGVETRASFGPEDLVGSWRREDGRTMTFGADGIVVDWRGERTPWRADPWQDEVVGAGITWVVWSKHGRLALLPASQVSFEIDPDAWNLHGMFFRDPEPPPKAVPAVDAGSPSAPLPSAPAPPQ